MVRTTTDVDPLSVADLLTYQRQHHARGLAVAVVALEVLVFVAVSIIHPTRGLLVSTGLLTVASAAAAATILAGRVAAGLFALIVAQLVGQIGVVVALGEISILPVFPSIVVLLAAATLGSPRIPWVLALALLTIGMETWLAVDYGGTRGTLLSPVVGGITLTVAAAVISLLHVRETERALGLAAERDRLRQRAVTKAHASEERHRLIADNTDDLIALVDESGRAEYLSPSYQRCLGRDLEVEAEGNLCAAVHAEDREAMLASLRRARSDGQDTATVRFGTADGRPLTYEVRLSRVTRGGRNLVAVIGRDVTLRRALEEQVRKTQRMEALDRLAGGIAHDFNNLLVVVSAAAEMAARNLHDPAAVRGDLQTIGHAVESAKSLTQQLLTFSRKQVATPQVLVVVETVRGLFDLVQRLVGESIQVELDMQEPCPRVQVPRSQLEQIIINVAANARDAMVEGGRFHLAVRRRAIAAQDVPGLVAGDYVEIAASDTGTGISPDVIPHLFEPFFTTKPETRGTGLGLATAYGIARQWTGTILVETEPGRGSTFRVLLPAVRSAPSTLEPDLTPLPVCAGQRVLLVDDDPAILKMLGRILDAAGFEVVTASTLAAAERELTDLSQRLDALITDVMLGNERGTELVPRARALRPRIRIVVISGYSPEPEATAALLGKRATFLAKPFNRQSLLEALGSVSSRA